MTIGNSRWRAYDEKGKLIKEETAATTTTWPTPRISWTACGRAANQTLTWRRWAIRRVCCATLAMPPGARAGRCGLTRDLHLRWRRRCEPVFDPSRVS